MIPCLSGWHRLDKFLGFFGSLFSDSQRQIAIDVGKIFSFWAYPNEPLPSVWFVQWQPVATCGNRIGMGFAAGALGHWLLAPAAAAAQPDARLKPVFIGLQPDLTVKNRISGIQIPVKHQNSVFYLAAARAASSCASRLATSARASSACGIDRPLSRHCTALLKPSTCACRPPLNSPAPWQLSAWHSATAT